VKALEEFCEYRPMRRQLLEFACGAAKLKWPHLTKVIGIGIDAPKYSLINSEDFILLNCDNWTEEDQAYYEKANAELRLFQTSALKETHARYRFPVLSRASKSSEDWPESALRVRIGQEI
jgi:hypothetical protein